MKKHKELIQAVNAIAKDIGKNPKSSKDWGNILHESQDVTNRIRMLRDYTERSEAIAAGVTKMREEKP